jgi:hypothetical protein
MSVCSSDTCSEHRFSYTLLYQLHVLIIKSLVYPIYFSSVNPNVIMYVDSATMENFPIFYKFVRINMKIIYLLIKQLEKYKSCLKSVSYHWTCCALSELSKLSSLLIEAISLFIYILSFSKESAKRHKRLS